MLYFLDVWKLLFASVAILIIFPVSLTFFDESTWHLAPRCASPYSKAKLARRVVRLRRIERANALHGAADPVCGTCTVELH